MKRRLYGVNYQNRKQIAFVCLLCCGMVVAFVYVLGLESEIQKCDKDFFFDLITISSIIAGFSFTNVGTLLSLDGSEIVKRLEGTDVMPHCIAALINSIIYCCLSILVAVALAMQVFQSTVNSICDLVNKEIVKEFGNIIIVFMYISVTVFLIIGIFFFLVATKYIAKFSEKMYQTKRNYSDKEINSIREKIKKGKEVIHDEDEFESD